MDERRSAYDMACRSYEAVKRTFAALAGSRLGANRFQFSFEALRGDLIGA
jgi:hypothetical protein